MKIDSNPVVLDPYSPVPLYRQIVTTLRARIDDGTFKPGDQLPSERTLADSLGVSRMTVSQAIDILLREGRCHRMRGRGIFVRPRPIVVDAQSFEGFTAAMRRAGRNAGTRVLAAGSVRPPDWVRDGLGLPADEDALEIRRLRLVDDLPAVLDTEWFPLEPYVGMLDEDLSGSLFALLERRYGLYIASTTDLLTAHMPSSDERRLLELPRGVPVIARDRIGIDQRGRVVEAVRSVYHPQRYEFRMAPHRLLDSAG